MEQSLYYLIYVSSASQLMNNDSLLALLNESRDNNLSLDITGMLLYKGGNFLQMLEGTKQHVLQVYQGICKDSRHHNIIKIISAPAACRSFQDWSMGFCNMEKETSLQDFPTYIHENLNLRQFTHETHHARSFIQSFNALNY
ncbi:MULTISPECIES: BLUF domain-containing protein [unclassified Endozoicomonas]|uniref:BLUF domain-containing protein n=1 Tax=unclassified Endozoicomonas TaxID=2644528 RepID=UPI003BB53117